MPQLALFFRVFVYTNSYRRTIRSLGSRFTRKLRIRQAISFLSSPTHVSASAIRCIYINTQKLLYIYIQTHIHTYIYICICIYNSNTYDRSSNFVLHVKKKYLQTHYTHMHTYTHMCIYIPDLNKLSNHTGRHVNADARKREKPITRERAPCVGLFSNRRDRFPLPFRAICAN